jgi:hypothetical protein
VSSARKRAATSFIGIGVGGVERGALGLGSAE